MVLTTDTFLNPVILTRLEKYPTLKGLLKKYRGKDLKGLGQGALSRENCFEPFLWLESHVMRQPEYLSEIDGVLREFSSANIKNGNNLIKKIFGNDIQGFSNYFAELQIIMFFSRCGFHKVVYEPAEGLQSKRPEFTCERDGIPFVFEVVTVYDTKYYFEALEYLDKQLSKLRTGLGIIVQGIKYIEIDGEKESTPSKDRMYLTKRNVDEFVRNLSDRLTALDLEQLEIGYEFERLLEEFPEIKIEVVSKHGRQERTEVSIIHGRTFTTINSCDYLDLNVGWVDDVIRNKEEKFEQGENNILVINLSHHQQMRLRTEGSSEVESLRRRVSRCSPMKASVILSYSESNRRLIDNRCVLFRDSTNLGKVKYVVEAWEQECA